MAQFMMDPKEAVSGGHLDPVCCAFWGGRGREKIAGPSIPCLTGAPLSLGSAQQQPIEDQYQTRLLLTIVRHGEKQTHRALHRACTMRWFLVRVLRIFGRFSGWQGCGGLRGRFRTARAQRQLLRQLLCCYPGNTPENHPTTEACMIHSNSIRGAELRTLGPVASIRLKQKIPGVPAGAVGCRIRDPGTRGYRW